MDVPRLGGPTHVCKEESLPGGMVDSPVLVPWREGLADSVAPSLRPAERSVDGKSLMTLRCGHGLSRFDSLPPTDIVVNGT